MIFFLNYYAQHIPRKKSFNLLFPDKFKNSLRETSITFIFFFISIYSKKLLKSLELIFSENFFSFCNTYFIENNVISEMLWVI